VSVTNISSISSSRLPEADLEHLAELAVTLSRRLAQIFPEGLGPAIGVALAEVAAATRADGCQLLEFTETGAVRAHSPTGTARGTSGQHLPPDPEDWLVDRLLRGEIVAISRPEELPREALAGREHARRTGAY